MDDKKLGGIGASEISKLFTKQGLKGKTAHTLILEKCEELINGYKKSITTIAMQHGIFNEEEAFTQVVKPCFPNSILRSGGEDSIWINDSLWATPDVTDDVEGLTIDIKCPYSIASFFTNVNKLPQSYIVQNQCQMMATGHKQGYVCVYLTSPNIDKWGNKIEYDIDINDRHRFIPLVYEEEYEKIIIEKHSEFIQLRDQLLVTLKDSSDKNTLSDIDFFSIHNNNKVTRLKDKSNIFAWDSEQIVRNNNIFYVIEKQ